MRQAILRTLLFASLGVVSSTALAKKPKIHTLDGGTVQIQGTVEVPLYDVPGFEGLPVVAAQVGEERLFLSVFPGLGHAGIYGDAVAKLGLETKDLSDTAAKATVESITIGGLTITEVEVATDGSDAPERWELPTSVGRRNVLSLDGFIGLAALDAAWAILPSEGVLRIVPTSEGDALVASVGKPVKGTEVMTDKSSRFYDARVVQKGTRKSRGIQPQNLVVPATINGKEGRFALHVGTYTTKIAASLKPADAPVGATGGRRYTWVSTGLGGVTVDTLASFDAQFDIDKEYGDDDMYPVDGVLGRRVTMRMDIARNNANGALAVKLVDKTKQQDPVPLMLADAEADLKEAMEAPKEATEEVQKDTTLPDGSAATWKAVAKAREAAGDYEGALEAWHTVAKFEPNGCQGWMEYGARVMEYDKPAKAVEALTKASSLYHAWWDWAPEVRAELGEILKSAEEAGEDYYFVPDDVGFVEVQGIREHDVAMGAPAPKMPEAGALIKSQPDSCDAADGYLARMELLKGNFDGVDKLYRDTFDLDTYVADLQGAAAIANGEPQKAHEALRQAIKREWHTGPNAFRRAALAQAYIAQGDRQSADELLSRGLELSDSILLHDQWIENSLELRGLGPTIQLAKARAETFPARVFSQLAAAKVAIDAGRTGQAKPDLERAETDLKRRQTHFKNSGATHTAAARLNVLKGDLALAEKRAARATELAPELGSTWYVAAEVAAAKGDAAQAKVYMKRALQASPTVIPFAKVLADAAE